MGRAPVGHVRGLRGRFLVQLGALGSRDWLALLLLHHVVVQEHLVDWGIRLADGARVGGPAVLRPLDLVVEDQSAIGVGSGNQVNGLLVARQRLSFVVVLDVPQVILHALVDLAGPRLRIPASRGPVYRYQPIRVLHRGDPSGALRLLRRLLVEHDLGQDDFVFAALLSGSAHDRANFSRLAFDNLHIGAFDQDLVESRNRASCAGSFIRLGRLSTCLHAQVQGLIYFVDQQWLVFRRDRLVGLLHKE